MRSSEGNGVSVMSPATTPGMSSANHGASDSTAAGGVVAGAIVVAAAMVVVGAGVGVRSTDAAISSARSARPDEMVSCAHIPGSYDQT